MKKTMFGMVASCLIASVAVGSAAPAHANGGQTFSSYGACRAAMVQARNDIRQGEGLFGPGFTGNFNAFVRYHFECVEVERNVWVLMRF